MTDIEPQTDLNVTAEAARTYLARFPRWMICPIDSTRLGTARYLSGVQRRLLRVVRFDADAP